MAALALYHRADGLDARADWNFRPSTRCGLAVKQQARDHASYQRRLCLISTSGYIGSALLALVFLALGALVQHGNGKAVKLAGLA